MTQSIPSYNPADTKSMAGSMRIFADYLLNLIENCQPCIVQSVDYSTNTVIVKPAINVSTTVGEYVQRDVIKLTAWRFASGGFLIHYPIKQGDTGWMIASDKDTSLFKQEKAIAKHIRRGRQDRIIAKKSPLESLPLEGKVAAEG